MSLSDGSTWRMDGPPPSDPVNLPQLEMVSPAIWQGIDPEPRVWLVEGVVPLRNVTMLSGDGGLGKSLITLQLMVACATGQTWLGQYVKPCKTLGLFCEDELNEIHRRMVSITDHYDCEMGDLEQMLVCSRVGLDTTLVDFDGSFDQGKATAWLGSLEHEMAAFGAQCVILDSLHDLFAGNENNRPQARQFIQQIRKLAVEHDAAMIISAHPSLSGRATGTGEAGSTAWNNAVRSRLYLRRESASPYEAHDDQKSANGAQRADDGVRVLETMKSNYGPSGGQVILDWKDGVYCKRDDETSLERRARGAKVERVFLKLLAELETSGRNVSDKVRASNYAPSAFAKVGADKRENCRYADFERAMVRLFDRGAIRMDTYGPPSKQMTRIIADEKAAQLPF